MSLKCGVVILCGLWTVNNMNLNVALLQIGVLGRCSYIIFCTIGPVPEAFSFIINFFLSFI